MNASLFIAKRYLFSRSSSNAINIITIIAALGIVFASAALIIVLSGFAGLKDFTLEFSSFTDPDLKVLPATGKTLSISEQQLAQLESLDDIRSFSKTIEERVVLNYQDKNEIVTLKGVDEKYPQQTIDSILVQGNWFAHGENQIVSGWGITNALGFGIFQLSDPIKVYVPKAGVGQISSMKGAYNVINAVNVGVFQINEDYDTNYVYTSYSTARKLLNIASNQSSTIELFLAPNTNIDALKTALHGILGQDIIIKDRAQLNDALYKMLNTENLAVYLIFTLVLIIALFNVIGAIIMMILDKRKDLKTLFNVGFTTKKAKQIFFYQGLLMTVIGGAIGVVIGAVLVVLQDEFGWFTITPSLPYPVALKTMDIFIVLFTIIVLGVIASSIASRRINKGLIVAS